MDPMSELRRRAAAAKSQTALAKELGISKAYLCNMLQGRADPGPAVLEALNIERVVSYRRKKMPAAANG